MARARAGLVPRRERERVARPAARADRSALLIAHGPPFTWAGRPLVAGAVGPRAQLLAPGGDGRSTLSQSLPSASPVLVLHRIRLIARTLEEQPGLTSADLAERMGYGRRHMSLLLLRLEEHGHVVQLGRRWFPGPEPVD